MIACHRNNLNEEGSKNTGIFYLSQGNKLWKKQTIGFYVAI